MSPQPRFDDDDDWVGTPPEGRHTKEQSNPGFWAKQPLVVSMVFVGIAVLAVVVVILAS